MEAARRRTYFPTWALYAAAGGVLVSVLGGLGGAGPVIHALRLLHSGVDYHEDASHSFFLAGAQSIICARNTGIYCGAFLTVLWAWAAGRGRAQGLPPLRVGLVLALLFGTMVADGFNSLAADLGYPSPYAPTTALRLGTGLLAGTAAGVYFLPVLNGLLWREPDERPVVPGYGALGRLLLPQLALWLAVMLGLDTLALPVALLTTAASLALLGGINLIFIVILLKLDNRVARLGQLLRPGTAALAVALVQLGLLAWLVRAVLLPA